MNIFPFRKRKQVLADFYQPIWQEDFILGRTAEIDRKPAKDDFRKEIEITRENEQLMAILKERAEEPATISLEDLKKQIESL